MRAKNDSVRLEVSWWFVIRETILPLKKMLLLMLKLFLKYPLVFSSKKIDQQAQQGYLY